MGPCPCFSASVCECDLVTHWAVRIDWGSSELAAVTRPGTLASVCHVWSTIPPQEAHNHSDTPIGAAAHTAHTLCLTYICTQNFYTISRGLPGWTLSPTKKVQDMDTLSSRVSPSLPSLSCVFFLSLSTLSAKWRRLHCSIWPILAEVWLDNKAASPAKKDEKG